jgi:hypothetical protein
MLSIAEKPLLIDLVKNAVDGIGIILQLFFIFVRQLFLGSLIAEGRMVGN